MKARILFVPAKTDMIFPPELSERAAARYRAQGGVARGRRHRRRRRAQRRRVRGREAGRRHQGVPVEVAERKRPRGVRPLADDTSSG
jgi:hypothetical protein